MSSDNFYLDANGKSIQKFDEVEVPEPNDTDIHNNAFTGMVDNLKNGYVVVVDQDQNFYEFEPERLEVLK